MYLLLLYAASNQVNTASRFHCSRHTTQPMQLSVQHSPYQIDVGVFPNRLQRVANHFLVDLPCSFFKTLYNYSRK